MVPPHWLRKWQSKDPSSVPVCASFFGVEFPGHWCCACTTGLQMPAYFLKWLCQFPLPPLMSDSLFVPWSTNKGNWTSIAYIKPAEGVSTGENSQRWHEYKWVGLLLSRSLSEAAHNKLTWPEVRLWDRKSHILVWRFSRITIEEARVISFYMIRGSNTIKNKMWQSHGPALSCQLCVDSWVYSSCPSPVRIHPRAAVQAFSWHLKWTIASFHGALKDAVPLLEGQSSGGHVLDKLTPTYHSTSFSFWYHFVINF